MGVPPPPGFAVSEEKGDCEMQDMNATWDLAVWEMLFERTTIQ